MRWTVAFKDGSAERVNASRRDFDRMFRGRRLAPVEAIYMPVDADPKLESYLRDEVLAPAACGWSP